MTTPLHIDETWSIREATLLGAEAAAVLAPVAKHTELADCGEGADKVVLVGWPFWLRLLATVAQANHYQLPDKAAR